MPHVAQWLGRLALIRITCFLQNCKVGFTFQFLLILSAMGSGCPALKAAMARIFGLNTFIAAFILVSSQATKPGIRFRITDNGLKYGKSCDFL